MKISTEVGRLERIVVGIPLLFLLLISIYHGFGKESKDAYHLNFWYYLNLFSHHLVIIYFALLVGEFSPYLSLRKIIWYLVIPYFSLKLLYTVLLSIGIRFGTIELWSYIWGIICVIIIIVGGLLLWGNLKKIGY